VSCGEVHSQAREMVKQGHPATLVATTLEISRSSLYYRKSRAAAERTAAMTSRSCRPAARSSRTAIVG
jgi:DNA invertase Pin-like site-specific DNA recombinase